MQKKIAAMLLLSVILSLFTGCQSPNIDSPPSTELSQPTEATEDRTLETTEATVPSSEATEPTPTETVYPRTIEAFKSILKPNITYGEVKALFGRKDKDTSGDWHFQHAEWYLDDGNGVQVLFRAPTKQTWEEYSAAIGKDEFNENFEYYYSKWFHQQEAYLAALYDPEGNRVLEILFDVTDSLE